MIKIPKHLREKGVRWVEVNYHEPAMKDFEKRILIFDRGDGTGDCVKAGYGRKFISGEDYEVRSFDIMREIKQPKEIEKIDMSYLPVTWTGSFEVILSKINEIIEEINKLKK